ncbi:MAG: hypothetical protein BGO68_03275 [Candidatus Amoebophilus sp. 36-38]|nr:MAG: hypothetical protein BGO68_03275 [Candidatus Amoebophilus sp. 36-38]
MPLSYKTFKKTTNLSLIILYYVNLIVGYSITSCQCKNSSKKTNHPTQETESSCHDELPSCGDLTIEVTKRILLGKDTDLSINFITTDDRIQLEDYSLKISLEDRVGSKNNKSNISIKNTKDLQTSINKPLTTFTSLLTSPTHVNNTWIWQLDFSLEPAQDCNELHIKIELFNHKTNTLIKTETATWKNLQLSFKDITYNPTTNLLTCMIEKAGTASVEELTLEYHNTSNNKATLNDRPNHSIAFTLQDQAQKELNFQLDFKNADIAEFNFRLSYGKDILTTRTIHLKNVQISIEVFADNHTFSGNKSIKCSIKNKGAYPVHTAELIMSVTNPPHVTFLLMSASARWVKQTPANFALVAIADNNKILASGETIPIMVTLSKATTQADAVVNLEIKDVDSLYTQPYVIQSLNWKPNRSSPNESTNSNVSSNTIYDDCYIDTTMQHEKQSVLNPPSNVTGTVKPTQNTMPTNSFQHLNSLLVQQPKDNLVPPTDSPNLPVTDKLTHTLTDKLSKQQLVIATTIELARELCFSPIDDKNILIKLIDDLWKSLPILDHYLSSIPEAVSNAYEKATRAYATLSVNLMDTELTYSLPDLAKKARHTARKTYDAAQIAKTQVAYTTMSNAYHHATMAYMARCKDKESIYYADQAFNLAKAAENAAYKAHIPEGYNTSTRAYYYATVAYQKIFNIYFDSDLSKCNYLAQQAKNAANRTRLIADKLDENQQGYTDAARAYAGVTELYSMLAIKGPNGTESAKEAMQHAFQTARAASIMADKTTDPLAKSAAKDAEAAYQKAIANSSTKK